MRKITSRYGRVTAVASATALVGAGLFTGTTAAQAAGTVAPVVTKLSAAAMSNANAAVATIVVTGKNFTGTSAVDLVDSGGAVANVTETFKVLSDTQLVATLTNGAGLTPAAGKQLKVTNGTGASANVKADDLDIVAPISVTGLVTANTLLNPLGKSVLSVTGASGFGATATAFRNKKITATVDGEPAPVTWVSDSAVNITAPTGTPSATAVSVEVYVNGVVGGADTTNAKYAAVVRSLSRTSGPLAGGGTVTVSGKGFTGATNWYFGVTNTGDNGAKDTSDRNLATCTVTNDTTASCTVPAAPQDGDIDADGTDVALAGAVSVGFTPAAAPYATLAGATYVYTDAS